MDIHKELGLTRDTLKSDLKKLKERAGKLSAELKVIQSLVSSIYSICGHPKAAHAYSRMDCPDCGYGEYYGDR